MTRINNTLLSTRQRFDATQRSRDTALAAELRRVHELVQAEFTRVFKMLLDVTMILVNADGQAFFTLPHKERNVRRPGFIKSGVSFDMFIIDDDDDVDLAVSGGLFEQVNPYRYVRASALKRKK